MSTNNRKFGKSTTVSSNGKSVTVGKWICYGYVDSRGQYHGQVRRTDAHWKQSVDMNSADQILSDIDGFIAACEACVSADLEKAYVADWKAKQSEAPAAPAPTAKRFGKPIE